MEISLVPMPENTDKLVGGTRHNPAPWTNDLTPLIKAGDCRLRFGVLQVNSRIETRSNLNHNKMSNYLQQLIDVAGKSRVDIKIEATGQGLTVQISKAYGTAAEPVYRTTSLWIDKNDKDMPGRMQHFIDLL